MKKFLLLCLSFSLGFLAVGCGKSETSTAPSKFSEKPDRPPVTGGVPPPGGGGGGDKKGKPAADT